MSSPSRRNPRQAPRGRSGRHRRPVQKITIARDTAVHVLWIALLVLVVAAIVVTIALSGELPRSPRGEGKRAAVAWLLAQSGLTNGLLGRGHPPVDRLAGDPGPVGDLDPTGGQASTSRTA